ncbi:hypothetical protein GCM10022415_03270 [Knoellia locipacati]|uniref:ATP-dependent endonuclease n=1 Tax=Knoellia locipacati TaxID=882824 RepID=A0A512SWE9_9MICO|nr:hypothetical protein [Knoellia locipacati]GEQ12279.1 hypothetical protein KLO01_03260 [Knoellia locipacati]
MTPSEPEPTWVLLEGTSDVAAVRALRATRGIAADEDPCVLVDMGGATNIRRHLDLAVDHLPRPRVVGLCDEREAPWFVRALDAHREALGLAAPPTLATLSGLGFHVCRRDLEDELLRALGVDGSLAVLDGLGLGAAFEAFTRQLAWQGRPVLDQLRRFGSTTSGRKELLAGAMAAALTIDATPGPLAALLDSLPAGRVAADPA